MNNQIYRTRRGFRACKMRSSSKSQRRFYNLLKLRKSPPTPRPQSTENNARNGLPLPDELVIHIFEYLDEWDRNSFELNAPSAELLLVCRQFRRVGSAFVYRHYEHNWSPDGTSSLPFMHTLHQNSELAEYVRTVQEHIYSRIRVPLPPFRRPFRYTVRDKITAIIDDLELPDRDNLVAQFVNGTHVYRNQELAILICLTPRIKELFINSMIGHPWRKYTYRGGLTYHMGMPPVLEPILHAARGIPYGAVHQFAHLNRLYISLHNLNLNAISPIFRLPSLRHLDLQNVREVSDVSPAYDGPMDPIPWECNPRESPIKELAFGGSILLYSSVVQAISSCKALKTFVYTILTNFEVGWYSNVVEALQEHSETLEVVAIVLPDFDERNLLGIGPQHTFRDFARLRVLQVPLLAVMTACGFVDMDETEDGEWEDIEEDEGGQVLEIEDGDDVEIEQDGEEDKEIANPEDVELEAEYIPEFGYPPTLTTLNVYTRSVDLPEPIQDYITALAHSRDAIFPNLSNMRISIYPLSFGEEEETWENRLDEDFLMLNCVTNNIWLEVNVDWETVAFYRLLTFGVPNDMESIWI